MRKSNPSIQTMALVYPGTDYGGKSVPKATCLFPVLNNCKKTVIVLKNVMLEQSE